MTAPQRSPEWQSWGEKQPGLGDKVIIVCDDGCSSSLALMTDEGLLDGEDGEPLTDMFLNGAIWAPLPSDYPLAFMERHDDY